MKISLLCSFLAQNLLHRSSMEVFFTSKWQFLLGYPPIHASRSRCFFNHRALPAWKYLANAEFHNWWFQRWPFGWFFMETCGSSPLTHHITRKISTFLVLAFVPSSENYLHAVMPVTWELACLKCGAATSWGLSMCHWWYPSHESLNQPLCFFVWGINK